MMMQGAATTMKKRALPDEARVGTFVLETPPKAARPAPSPAHVSEETPPKIARPAPLSTHVSELADLAHPANVLKAAIEAASSPLPAEATLLSSIEAVPDVAGRIAEYLFCLRDASRVLGSGEVLRRRRADPEMGQLLLSGRTARLMMVVSIKERRRFTDRKEGYGEMCVFVERACRRTWFESRPLRQYDTGDADIAALLDTWARSRPVTDAD